MLKTLNASKAICSLMPSLGRGIFLIIEKSMLNTDEPREVVRPRFPNELTGLVYAQGLNQWVEF
jgi:hypothetical protein